MKEILIVEDNKDMQFILKNVLEAAGYKIISTGNGQRALLEAKKKRPDLVLLDMRLPGMNGLDVLKKIRNVFPQIYVIMMTAYTDVNDAVEAMKLGAYDYIAKPFRNDELLIMIEKILKTESMVNEINLLRKMVKSGIERSEMIGISEATKKVLHKIEMIAPTDMSVILQGKSGTGKEVVAKKIHKHSNRKNKPFVGIDCGAIPPSLIESELFGYEAGAFTGADRAKKGKFEIANKGTILLDEITNLSMESQAKLLRALEEKQIQPIGAKEPRNIDVRVIVTTNIDFKTAILQGEFRDDLYHRLNEFQILLPELKNRKEDIEVLAENFLIESNIELDKNIKGISKEALKLLAEYDWPGNIRELKHTIKRATLVETNEYISVESLDIELLDEEDNETYIESLKQGESFNDIVAEVEKDLIIKALEIAKGNKTKAAEILKLNRKTLYRKLDLYNLK